MNGSEMNGSEINVPPWREWLGPNLNVKVLCIYALASKVLAVAVARVDGWSAYCDSVPGINHQMETGPVIDRGDKLSEEVAIVLFPDFKDWPYCT